MRHSHFSFFITMLLLGLLAANIDAQNVKGMKTRVSIAHISRDFPIASLTGANWKRAAPVLIDSYWSGEAAPAGRHFTARLLWSNAALYVLFEADQTEPLVISDKPDLTKKVRGLWDRDVCEIFIAPNKAERNKYFEFEIAPTGEWIDLGIEVTPSTRLTDWDYASGIKSAVKIKKDKVVMAVRIEWKALGKTPKPGDIWLGNLFRCVGKDPTRGYLSWQPTNTKEPSFHVPAKFGEFEFVK